MVDIYDRLAVPTEEFEEVRTMKLGEFEKLMPRVEAMVEAIENEVGAKNNANPTLSNLFKKIAGEQFVEWWDDIAASVHALAVEKGWWDQDRNDGEIIALLHSELSEALEALREGNPPSKKIPEFSSLEEELADEVIRIMDYGEKRGLRLGDAIVAKHAFNATRPVRHGKKF